MKATLATIAKLLQHPDSRYPLNQEADLQSREIPSLFKERAQEWAVKYAGAPATETDRFVSLVPLPFISWNSTTDHQ